MMAIGMESPLDGKEMTLEELEREYIRRVLRKVRGHKGKAAKILGINRKTLWEKRKRYQLD
jgi:two-component system response regulator AtoC